MEGHAMPAQSAMKAALQAYLDRYNASDLDGLMALFAEDATFEDPVGTPAMRGHAQIRDFLVNAMKTPATLSLAAPIRGSHGNAAAMAFEAHAGQVTVRAIEVAIFGEDGRIVDLKAYIGPDDIIRA
jgi:steroid delta-isomerase